jgi:hypothetical protein
MKSEYSSVLRTVVWGGIPISLPAMAVFAFLLFFGGELLLSRRQGDRRATGLLALGAAVPTLASLVMAYISITKLGSVCKLCAGITRPAAWSARWCCGCRRGRCWCGRPRPARRHDRPAVARAWPRPGSASCSSPPSSLPMLTRTSDSSAPATA